MPRSNVLLPPAALEHLSDNAQQHLPPGLQGQVADIGVYSETGMLGLGPGWYHIGTAADDLFLGHPGEPDYFIFDFAVTEAGSAQPQGDDVATHFERALDGIVILNSFAEVEPGVSFNSVAEGLGPRAQLEERIEYTLVLLRFEGPVAIETEIGRIGTFGFSEFV